MNDTLFTHIPIPSTGHLRTVMLLCALLVTSGVVANGNNAIGKAAYKKGNCVGCHKWHGGGGGGYGGVALSLRESQLDRESLILTVRCGRPGTRMPYHDRKAWRGDNTGCYDITKAELGNDVPPRARFFLREQEIDALVDYIQTHIQGRGAPGYEDCVIFWGADARRCKAMKTMVESTQ